MAPPGVRTEPLCIRSFIGKAEKGSHPEDPAGPATLASSEAEHRGKPGRELAHWPTNVVALAGGHALDCLSEALCVSYFKSSDRWD
jgi:hypothetical protein